MGIDTIISRIAGEAGEEAGRIKRRAEEEARSVIADAETEGESEYRRIVAEGRREIRSLTRRILAQASIDARRMIREEKEKEIAACFAEAEKCLQRIAQSGEYRALLNHLIAGGIEELGTAEAVVVATERDHDLVAEIIAGLGEGARGVHLNPECAITAGGVILRTRSGSITVNNTFEARIERFRDDLSFEVARILYGRE